MLAIYANWQAMITARLIWLSACLTMLAASLSMLLGRLGMLHMLVENASYAECLCSMLARNAGWIYCLCRMPMIPMLDMQAGYDTCLYTFWLYW
jgi:hypothetical protein